MKYWILIINFSIVMSACSSDDCPKGYQGENCSECIIGYHKNDETDECDKDIKCNEDSCSNQGTCEDTTGIPICSCNDGYAGDSCETCAVCYEDNGDGECRQVCSKLLASDGQEWDHFGWSVSISGDVAIVGALGEDGGDGDPMSKAGAAYIYQLENGMWTQKQKLTATDARPDDYFGSSVSISGDVAIVGAYGSGGAAYIFQLDNGEWTQKQKLTASDAQAGDSFGNSVSINGNVAIVGAPYEDGGEGSPINSSGAAYIFKLENGEWTQKKKLVALDSQKNDRFGWSVSVSGDLSIVGAPSEDGEIGDPDNIIDGPGAAYIFQLENDEWIEKQKLIALDAKTRDDFGNSVSISDDVAVVGDPWKDGGAENAGAAYIFQLIDGQWTQSQKLFAADYDEDDNFGYSVSVSENTIIVGAFWKDLGDVYPIEDAGAAYIFQQDNGQWTQKRKIVATDAKADIWFGFSVSISGDVVIIGAYHHERLSGAAYIYPLGD